MPVQEPIRLPCRRCTEAAQNTDPAIGYSLAYPFGIIGAILCMYFLQLIVKPRTEESKSGFETMEVAIRHKMLTARLCGEVTGRYAFNCSGSGGQIRG